MKQQTKEKVFNQTDEFKDLEQTWNQKLKDSGLNDIETQAERQNNVIAKQIITPNPKWIAYFRKCEAHMNSGKMKDTVDNFIFFRHCEGKTNSEIAEEYGKAFKFDSISKDTVNRRIKKILEAAEIEPVHFPNV